MSLKDSQIAAIVSNQYYNPGERSLIKIVDHAAHVEQEITLRAVYKNKPEYKTMRASIMEVTQNTTTKKSKGKKKATPTSAKKEETDVKASIGATTKASGAASNGASRAGWNGASTGATIHAASTPYNAPPEQPKVNELWRKMRSLGLYGCVGCLGPGHRWDNQYSRCRAHCPFCHVPYTDRSQRHLAAECPMMPKTRNKILAMSWAVEGKNGQTKAHRA